MWTRRRPPRIVLLCALAALARGALGLRLDEAAPAPARGPGDGLEEAMRRVQARLPREVAREVFDFATVRYQVASCSMADSATLWGPGGARCALRGHGSEVDGVQFFPLGDRVLTWSRDRTAIVWNATSGKALRTLRHRGAVKSAVIFPSGDRVATCGDEGACVVWRVDSGEALGVWWGTTMRGLEVVLPLADRVLSWGGHSWAAVWEAQTGDLVCALHGHESVIAIARAFSEAERAVTGSRDRLAIVWDTSTCRPLHRLRHAAWVSGVAVVDRDSVVVTIDVGGAIAVWCASSGERLRTMSMSSPWPVNIHLRVESLGSGRRVVSFSGDAVVLWDLASGEALHHMASYGAWFHDLRVSPGGDMLVACSVSHLTIWDAGSGARTHRLAESLDSASPPTSCSVAIGLGRSLDPQGFGRGLPWHRLASS